MEIDFSSFDDKLLDFEEEYIILTKITLELIKIVSEPIISVSIVDNKDIHKINLQYRGIDRPTDVISFAFLDNEDYSILNKPGSVVLGDIYISYEKAVEQAKEFGHSIKKEMLFLYVHGLLHLLGYDHLKEEDENIMFPIQDKVFDIYLKEGNLC